MSASHGVDDLRQFAMETIEEAGARAISFYGKGKRRVKFDMGLVTETELQLTDFFRTCLNEKFPQHQIFMNNHDLDAYTHDEKRYLWIYDAIDGVANFQAGIPIWGMSIALLENFWPILGIFHMPATGDLFHAQAGQKAYWGNEEIRISSQDSISDESLFLTFSRFHQGYRSTFPGKIRNLGCTGAHLCYVAMGRAEAALVANITYPDLAATRVIVESAGGKFFRTDGREFFLNEYLDGSKIEDHLLVSSPQTQAQVRSFIEPTLG